ncbi:MAG: hypothetical protein GWO04_43755, partial [Actinobacteria bacterium]|nr:hypothetical protein [Actinomycetota bacterium]
VEATIANISMGVTAAGVAAAVIGLFLSDFSGDEAPVTAGVAPLPDGASVAVAGRLP